MPVNEVSLTSLAVLKVHWDKGHDYIDNFVPFIVEAIQRSPGGVTVVEIQQTVRTKFGLMIPQGAIATLLRRAEKKNLIQKNQERFTTTAPGLDTSFERTRADVERQQQALIQRFIDYCAAKHQVQYTEEVARRALVSHLQSSCVPILAASIDGCAIPLTSPRSREVEFLVSAFTVELYERDPVGFGFLETVMKGSLLANALFLPDISKTEKRFDKLSAYLDTPILLRALGHEGAEQQTSARELLSALYELNVDLCCFDITRDEVRGVLDAAQHALRDPRPFSKTSFAVYAHFVSIGAHSSDVELIKNNLDKSIKRLRVSIRETPHHVEHLTLDEGQLETRLRSEMPTQREEARHHDLNCLTAIYRLRKGQHKGNIESCGHVFVTSNFGLSVASAKFASESGNSRWVPLCLNEYTMATLAWVKNPSLAEEFSRHRLIAESYAALRPTPELWRKYLDEIQRLRSRGDLADQDVHLLRFSTSAANTLVELTLGGVQVVEEETVHAALQAARAEARLDTELALANEEEKRAISEREQLTLASKIATLHARLENLGASIGKWASYTFFFAIWAACLIASFLTLRAGIVDIEQRAKNLSLAIPLFIFVTLSSLSVLDGGVVRRIGRTIEIAAARKATIFLKRFFRAE